MCQCMTNIPLEGSRKPAVATIAAAMPPGNGMQDPHVLTEAASNALAMARRGSEQAEPGAQAAPGSPRRTGGIAKAAKFAEVQSAPGEGVRQRGQPRSLEMTGYG